MVRHAILFSTKTIEKFCQDVQVTEKQKSAATTWLKLLEKNQLKDEQSNYPNFQQLILQDVLNYSREQIIFEKNNMEYQIKNSDEVKIVGIEAKGTSKDLFAYQHYDKKEQEKPIMQLATYMITNNLEYGICTNYNEFVLIMKQFGLTKLHRFKFDSIKNNEKKLKEFIGIFGRERILQKGFIEKLYKESVEEDKKLTNEFYNIFHQTRLMMIKEFRQNLEISKNDAIHYTQIYLNRLIFMFFVEDRQFIYNRTFTEQISFVLKPELITEHTKLVCERVNILFTSLDKGSKLPEIFGFNGGLFQETIPPKIYFSDLKDPEFFTAIQNKIKISKKERLNEFTEKLVKKIPNNINPIIINLLQMNSYDFTSQLNVDILGHIFEQSISDLEEIYEENTSKRKKEGVYYTPEYITDYICRSTIIHSLSKNNSNTITELIREYSSNIKELENKIEQIKILDPACGSGAFLVKATDVLLDISEEINQLKKTPSTVSQFQLSEFNKETKIYDIIENCIYGVDINDESVEITKLSLFLKLAGPNRKLIGLSKNIKIGNSLIHNKNIDGKAFDWNVAFAEAMHEQYGGFDIVIGNPPYGAEVLETQKNYLKDNFQSATGRYDTYFYFIEKGISLLNNNGRLGFIIPDTWLTNVQAEKLRKFVLDNCCIQQIIGLPQNVFSDAMVDTCLIILKKEVNVELRLKNDIDVCIINKNIQIENIHDGVFQTKTSVKQKQWASDKRSLFTIFTVGERLASIDMIKENTVNLGNITEMRRGVFCYRKSSLVKEFGEEKGTEIIEKRLWHSDHRVNNEYKKELVGSDISRYDFEWLNKKWFRYGKHIASYVEPRFFETDYIAVQRIRNPALKRRLIATIIKSGNEFYASSGLTSIIRLDKSFSLYYLLALINSKLLNWYFKQFFRDVNIKPEDLRELPIKKLGDIEQKPFIERAEQIIKLNDSLNELKRKFTSRLEDNFDLKVSTKLSNFEELSFKELMSELLKKQKIQLTYSQQEELEDYFTKRKSEIISIKENISKLDSELDMKIYELYKLSKEEISLIEEDYLSK